MAKKCFGKCAKCAWWNNGGCSEWNGLDAKPERFTINFVNGSKIEVLPMTNPTESVHIKGTPWTPQTKN